MSAAPADIPLRLLRAVEAVARLGSAARAAEALHLSASAVSRAVVQAEADLGQPLFERAARGMVATPAGSLLAGRVSRALAALRAGGGATLAARAGENMLQALVLVAELRSEGAAAGRLRLSQPAVHQSLRQLEHAARGALLHRSRRGSRLTEAGERLLRAAKLAQAELRTAGDELAALQGGPPGTVVLGALPMTADVLVPQALTRLFAAQPGCSVTVVDGTYQGLLQQLRDGDLDLVVGPLRGPEAPADVAEQVLFIDHLLPVLRAGHPLLAGGRAPRSLRPLLRWPWIGPLPGTPARAAFERAFESAGLAVPAVALQANSPAVVRSVLMAGDAVALVSALQIRAELASGLLTVLPVRLQGTQRAIGLMQRRDSLAPAAVQALVAELQQVAESIALATSAGRS